MNDPPENAFVHFKCIDCWVVRWIKHSLLSTCKSIRLLLLGLWFGEWYDALGMYKGWDIFWERDTEMPTWRLEDEDGFQTNRLWGRKVDVVGSGSCPMGVFVISDVLPSDQSRDSPVGIALVYGLDDRGSRVRFPAGAGNFSPHHRVQNGSGAHPASCPMGNRGSFPGCKAAGAWSWPLTSI
jgi:hypothetical protein